MSLEPADALPGLTSRKRPPWYGAASALNAQNETASIFSPALVILFSNGLWNLSGIG